LEVDLEAYYFPELDMDAGLHDKTGWSFAITRLNLLLILEPISRFNTG
jgi:hypothetical protein